MGRIVELPSINPRPTSRRQGLRKLSPDLISKARDETATQVTRVGLTFVGTASFCLLSLLTPDSTLLGGTEKINVPFAGPVSFFGFMLLGPVVLIALRVYLQIYVEHGDRLDRIARSVSIVRAPTLIPLHNSLIRLFSGLIFYLLMPVTMMLFAWKAAVFPAWGAGLFGLAVAVIASHVMLSFRRYSWRSKEDMEARAIKGEAIDAEKYVRIANGVRRLMEALKAGLHRRPKPAKLVDDLERSILVAIIAGGVMLYFAPLRPFDLYQANLSGQSLLGENLRRANLMGANLSGADLTRANLSDASLYSANLSGANLMGANLSGAHLSDANLSGANLYFANLSGADLYRVNLSGADLYRPNLSGANLLGAKNLTQTQLDKACGNADTKLPEGLTLKPCSKN
jgi:hypothetical protein